MKKLLIVSQYFWPEEFRINELAFALGEKDLQVSVLTQTPNYPNRKIFKGNRFRLYENYNKVSVTRIPTIPRGKSKTSIFFNYLSYIVLSLPYFLFFRFKKYSYILVFQPSPVFVGLWPSVLFNGKRVKKLIWILDLWPDTFFSVFEYKFKLLNSFVVSISRFIYKSFDVLLVQTEGFKKRLQELGISKSNIEIFPNFSEEIFLKPLDRNSLIQENVDKIFKDIPEGFNIIFAGNLGYSQDIPAVLEAAKLTKQSKINWILVGTGRALEDISKQIQDDKIGNVMLLGRFDLEYMPYFFNKSDAMLVTLSDQDTFSLTIPGKIPSYMACSKPILGMLNGEGKRLIEASEAGLCSNAGDFVSLSKNAISLSNLSREELDVYSKNSFDYYQENLSKLKAVHILREKIEDD